MSAVSRRTRGRFASVVDGAAAGLSFKVHPHMLRHACGYALADRGTDTRAIQGHLRHRNIQHTVVYTELSPTRFEGICDE